eukprot:363267-Chlamydomonas_euryale.AAC.15
MLTVPHIIRYIVRAQLVAALASGKQKVNMCAATAAEQTGFYDKDTSNLPSSERLARWQGAGGRAQPRSHARKQLVTVHQSL